MLGLFLLGATWDVCTQQAFDDGEDCDFVGIETALMDVSFTDGDTLALSGGVHDGARIDRDVTLQGDIVNGSTMSTITGSQVLAVDSAVVVVNDLIVSSPVIPAIRAVDATLEINRGQVSSGAVGDVTSTLRGTDSDIRITTSIFNAGQSASMGGLLNVTTGGVEIEDSVFQNGVAQSGGAVSVNKLVTSLIPTGLTIRNTLFRNNLALGRGGAVSTAGLVTTEVEDALFEDNLAIGDGGALSSAASLVGMDGGNLSISGTSFDRNTAYDKGGAVFNFGGTLTVDDSSFTRNAADVGGAVYMHSQIVVIPPLPFALDVSETLFCGNTAADSGGGVYTVNGGTWHHVVLIDNTAPSGAAVYLDAPDLPLEAAHLDVLGNDLRAAADTELGIANSLLAFSDAAVTSGSGATVTLTHSALWANGATALGDGDVFEIEMVTEDPLLWQYTANGDCSDDQTWGPFGSSLHDAGAGDPDPDGSPADIGFHGARDADYFLWQDPDGDGSPQLYDCDEGDPNTHPGAEEVWYDGHDRDCARDNDFDQDKDGWDAGPDCRDSDPDIHPDAKDEPYDGIDTNCDESDDDDLDGDGFPLASDCDDDDPTIHPTAVDDNPGLDVDCDGYTDRVETIDLKGCATVSRTPTWTRLLRRR